MSPRDARSAAIRLIAWVQEEIGAQRRLEALLAEQEAAIRAVDTASILATGARVQEELRGAGVRERRRMGLMNELASAWNVDARALTLSSVAERLGEGSREAELLRAQRVSLRTVAAEVARRGRRVASLAHYHAGLFGELMNTLLGADGARTTDDGVLVDAQA